MYSSTLFLFYFFKNVVQNGWSFVFFTLTIFITLNKSELPTVAVELQ